MAHDPPVWQRLKTVCELRAKRLLLASAAVYLSAGCAAAAPRDFLQNSDSWFAGAEAKQVVENILSFQSDSGGWPKNVSTTDSRYTGDRKKLQPTYDNGATTDELRFLARICRATGDGRCREAFSCGLSYVLTAQYPNGGWPQFHPPGKGYHRHITFNDGAMVRLLQFLREVATDELYAFVGAARRKEAAAAFDRGISCILQCQINVDGKLTAWCAQHDEIDFRPRPARSYELATLSGSESVGITRLLMSLDEPSPSVVDAVEGAIAWFRSARLTGLRVETVKDARGPKGLNRVVVQDLAAPPLWARFYSLQTNQPVFVDRDGIPKQRLDEIGYERRNGYAWYGSWPQRLLEEEYPKWRKQVEGNAKP